MERTGLKIRLLGDKVLRKKASCVINVTERHRELLSQMSRLMYGSQGIGLAAPQVGISQALIVADIGQGLFKLINPRITKKSGTQAIEEGCLSVPNVSIKVKRAKEIQLEAWDEYGKPVQMEAEDLLACVLQHEIDHINGKLIVDYASFVQKLKIGKKLDRLKKRAENEKLSESRTESGELQL